jgi:hypothetical protein
MDTDLKAARTTRKFGHGGCPQADDATEQALAHTAFIEAGADLVKQNEVLKAFPFLAGTSWRKYAPDLLQEEAPSSKLQAPEKLQAPSTNAETAQRPVSTTEEGK